MPILHLTTVLTAQAQRGPKVMEGCNMGA